MPTGQLALNLPHREARGRDDFLVSESNAAAVAMIDRWPDWPASAVLLTGPAGAGKSHLAEVWRAMADAPVLHGLSHDAGEAPELLKAGALVIEDLPGDTLGETLLFHLLNLSKETKSHLLLTARELPASWGVRLPDLASRLKALPVVSIGLADDSLLRGVLLKLFADRQIDIDEAVLGYLVSRIPRSLETAGLVVAGIDRLALEQGASINRSFVSRILPQLIENAQLNLFIE